MNLRIALATGATIFALGTLPTAAHAASCTPPEYPSTGYFTTLTVTKTSCSSGKKLVLAYFKCRKAHGGIKGKCPSSKRINGYKCKETRKSIATEFNARVTCTSGSKKIVHTYQQNT